MEMSRLPSILVLLGIGCLASPVWAQFDSDPESIERGRELFTHQWKPNDTLSPNGDGLGPVYNANSCVACHAQGGIGGSGANESNAQMLAFVPEPGKFTSRNIDSIRNRLRTMHPLFVNNDGNISTGVLLHRYSTNPDYAAIHANVTQPLEETFNSRTRMRRMLRERNLSDIGFLPLKLVTYTKDLQFALAERNPPQLFGAGEIADKVLDSDIEAIARAQLLTSNETGISGRKVGRFGWRGQLDDLSAFVKGACAAEVGLQVDQMYQSPDPTKPNEKLEGVDLTADQTKQLIDYVAALPRPAQVLPEDPNARSRVTQGHLLFESIGCASCHVEDVGALKGVFSDFLLHDMGPEFEDPIPAQRIPVQVVSIEDRYEMPSYYGSDYIPPRIIVEKYSVAIKEDRKEYREYRTPPLWGVADSGPYLHDGRAESIRAAIELHNGEARGATATFMRLNEEEQFSVISFLESLKAPESAEMVPDRVAERPVTDVDADKISSTIEGTMDSVASR